MLVQHGSVMAVGAEVVALEPEARDQGSVQMAGGLGPSVLGSGRSVALVSDLAG